MIGSSLGGYLAPRAAAFDDRIGGVVAFGVVYDFGETAQRKLPGFVKFLMNNGYRGIAGALISLKMKMNTTLRWGMHNAQWTLGVDDPVDVPDAMSKFNLAEVAGKIRCPILIVSGEKDHLVPVEQVEKLRSKLVNAKSVTTRIFDVESGGAEHCQIGAFSLFYEELFDWMEKTIK
jgi:pimeloyl-ACP methyl ester carboxylesterase